MISHSGVPPCRLIDPSGATCRRQARLRARTGGVEDGVDASQQQRRNATTPRAPPRVQQPLRPNRAELTPEEFRDAKVLEAAKVAGRRGDFKAAQEALEGTGLKVDAELSDLDGLVVRDTKNKTLVAYRGTRLTRARDVIADARILAGMQDEHFAQGSSQLRRVAERYGRAPERLLGYSLGGARAVALGSAHGVPTRTFNPFLGNLGLLHATGRHHVIRTTEDFATLGLPFGKNFKVTSVLPRETHLSPERAHSLANFTDPGLPRRAGVTEELAQATRDAGARAGELELLRDIHRTPRQRTFTHWLHEFNGRRGQDTSADGSRLAGKRVHAGSKMLRFWKQSGRGLTASEQAHVESLEPLLPRPDATTASERTEFLRSSAATQDKNVERAHARIATAARATNAHLEHAVRAMHPTTLALGLGTGLAAQGAVNAVLPSDTPESVKATVSGVAAGVAGEAAAATLAGTAFTATAAGVAGAVGGVAALGGLGADAGSQAVAHALGASDDVSEGIGAGVGGAVAGGVGAGMLAGGEVGLVGGPMGVALGAGVGALLGLGGFLVGKLVH